jgi:hypothetical protein
MFCRSAEEMIIEHLDHPLDEDRRQSLLQHLSACDACRRFQQVQKELDVALMEHFTIPVASLDFNKRLMQKIAEEERSILWDILPDLLHISGGLLTTLVCIWLLPFSRHLILSVGLGGTLLSYLLQILLRLHLEELERT